MTRQAFFANLIVDEDERPVATTLIGQEAHYVIDDAGFLRHVPAERVDRQVLAVFLDQLEDNKDLFADSAILGASIILQCTENINTRFVVKDYKEPEIWIPLSLDSPDVDHPSVKRWYTGNERVIEYVNLFRDNEDKVRGYQLYLDLDRIKANSNDCGTKPD